MLCGRSTPESKQCQSTRRKQEQYFTVNPFIFLALFLVRWRWFTWFLFAIAGTFISGKSIFVWFADGICPHIHSVYTFTLPSWLILSIAILLRCKPSFSDPRTFFVASLLASLLGVYTTNSIHSSHRFRISPKDFQLHFAYIIKIGVEQQPNYIACTNLFRRLFMNYDYGRVLN